MLEQLGHIHLAVWIGEKLHWFWLRLRGIELTVRDIYPECTEFSNANINYKSKVRVILTNQSKHSLIVSSAIWDSRLEGLPIQVKPVGPSQPQDNKPASTLNLESAGGWQIDPAPNAWLPEASTIEVPPNKTFRIWVGLRLDEPSVERRQTNIRRRYVQRTLGTLILPVKKEQNGREIRFKLRL